jgi:hypothetical protein
MYEPPRPRQTSRSGSGVPPSADSRIALMPHVGASAHEMGRTQFGRSASGTRKPQISQTGYSKKFPSTQAARKRTNETAKRSPRPPNDSTVPKIARTKRSGCSIVSGTPNTKRPQSSVAARL